MSETELYLIHVATELEKIKSQLLDMQCNLIDDIDEMVHELMVKGGVYK